MYQKESLDLGVGESGSFIIWKVFQGQQGTQHVIVLLALANLVLFNDAGEKFIEPLVQFLHLGLHTLQVKELQGRNKVADVENSGQHHHFHHHALKLICPRIATSAAVIEHAPPYHHSAQCICRAYVKQLSQVHRVRARTREIAR